jgi:hypothetical protein
MLVMMPTAMTGIGIIGIIDHPRGGTAIHGRRIENWI